MVTRWAVVENKAWELAAIKRYLPDNYKAFTFGNDVIIMGIDSAGWTLDEYVIPRLRQWGITAVER